MQLSVDHVSLGVAELRSGVGAFRALGFELVDEGDSARIHTGTASLVLTATRAFSGLGALGIVSDEPLAQGGAHLPLRVVSSGVADRRAVDHPNGVLRLERVYIAVPDVRLAAGEYAAALRMPMPAEQRGNVIKARMCVFDLGAVGVVVAEPVEDGPAAEALSRAGAGPFQVLFRVRGLDSVARWMVEHGVPEPARGTRNTGEAAILVPPEYACGAYVAFVGPA